MATCQLYRHFDDEGQLLYVGISLSAVNRLSQHKGSAQWFSKIAEVRVEKFSTREEALAAEKAAIISEKPKFNIKCANLKGTQMLKNEIKPVTEFSLVGRFFHVFREEGFVNLQGVVRSKIDDRNYLVQLFSWFDGSPTELFIVPIEQMIARDIRDNRKPNCWQFYEDAEHMNFFYEYSSPNAQADKAMES